jgi:hypothetical protein
MRICCPFIAKRFWFGNVLTTPRLPKFSSRTSLRAVVPPVCRVKHPAKLVILDSEILDVLHEAFHNNSTSVAIARGLMNSP